MSQFWYGNTYWLSIFSLFLVCHDTANSFSEWHNFKICHKFLDTVLSTDINIDPGFSSTFSISNLCKYFPVSPCASDPCENDGTCSVNENGNAVCTCKGDFSGSTCSGRLKLYTDIWNE